jgi:hypothetical protein
MNDFTKEELQMIGAWGELYKYGMGLSWPQLCSKKNHNKLIKKILFLINNYCEHKWTNYCYGCDLENLVCEKCERGL